MAEIDRERLARELCERRAARHGYPIAPWGVLNEDFRAGGRADAATVLADLAAQGFAIVAADDLAALVAAAREMMAADDAERAIAYEPGDGAQAWVDLCCASMRLTDAHAAVRAALAKLDGEGATDGD